jgi:hypothetical protein
MRTIKVSDADETSIPTGLASTPLLAAGNSVDSGPGLRWLAPAGARGSDIYTCHRIHSQVVADQTVGMAIGIVDVGQFGFCNSR